MNIDPRNPVFRYIDKAVFVVAVLVALLAVMNLLSGPKPAAIAVDQAEQAKDDLEQAAQNKPVPDYNAPEQCSQLANRFDPAAIENGTPFRLFVFYSPDEIVGDPIPVSYRPDLPFLNRDVTTYYITRDYGNQYPDLRRVDYSKAATPIVVGDANIADIRLNVEKKGIDIRPRQAGEANVRIEFAEGTSFEFLLTVTEGAKLNERVPRAPVNLTSAGGPGYVNLTWATNPQSSPAVSYNIYRSDSIDTPFEKVDELQVSGAEDPATAPADAEIAGGKIALRKYAWDDLKAKPGHKYYYQVETTSYVVNKAGKNVVEPSNKRAEVEASAESTISVALVGGVAGQLATFEMQVTEHFVPSFEMIMAHPGEAIKNRNIDSGYRLVDIVNAPVENEREMPVFEDGKLVRKPVKFIKLTNTKAIVIDDQGRVSDRTIQMRKERDYQAKVRELINNPVPKAMRTDMPKFDMKPGSTIKPEITVVNKAQHPVTIAFRDGRRKNAVVEIPWNMARTFQVEDGNYEVVAEYPPVEGLGKTVYYAEKLSLKEGKHYDLTLDIPKKVEQPADGGAVEQPAPEAAPADVIE